MRTVRTLYLIQSLYLECFRGFLSPYRVEFTETKKSLIILGPNGSGKSCLADAFEYILSKSGTIIKLGEFEDASHNKAGSSALINSTFDNRISKALVGTELSRITFQHKKKKVESFKFVRNLKDSKHQRTEDFDELQSSICVSPHIRGEEFIFIWWRINCNSTI